MRDMSHNISVDVDVWGELAQEIADLVKDHKGLEEAEVRAVSFDSRTGDGELVLSVPLSPDEAVDILEHESRQREGEYSGE